MQYGLEKPPNDFSDDDDEDDDDSFGMSSKKDQRDSVESKFKTLINSLNNMYFVKSAQAGQLRTKSKFLLYFYIFRSYLSSA